MIFFTEKNPYFSSFKQKYIIQIINYTRIFEFILFYTIFIIFYSMFVKLFRFYFRLMMVAVPTETFQEIKNLQLNYIVQS